MDSAIIRCWYGTRTPTSARSNAIVEPAKPSSVTPFAIKPIFPLVMSIYMRCLSPVKRSATAPGCTARWEGVPYRRAEEWDDKSFYARRPR